LAAARRHGDAAGDGGAAAAALFCCGDCAAQHRIAWYGGEFYSSANGMSRIASMCLSYLVRRITAAHRALGCVLLSALFFSGCATWADGGWLFVCPAHFRVQRWRGITVVLDAMRDCRCWLSSVFGGDRRLLYFQ